ncbi:MAG: HAD hydrolase-like protein, partial [Clostridia bacterium]|nr:HAD hydrolase-like protein [Clostridia bacterium]
MRRCVIFDLDGTLTKSEEGIFNCALEACRQMGWPQPDAETLRRFVGPPLKYSFQHELGMTDSQADEAVRHYRARYQEVGLFENRVYPGIRRLLRALKARGVYLAIATGKPTGPSCRIAEHFGFARWMDRIVGPEDSADAGKAELIRSALPDDFDPDKDLAWMVGDRKFDIEGGQKVGISTIGVGYGYGSREELEAAGCDVYAGTVQELYTALLELTSAEETREIPEPRGAFLAMEGLDGSGKSTQISALTD